ncbi:mechanosensitive ion channel domain-containing protein, partial [Clostridioides difficile]
MLNICMSETVPSTPDNKTIIIPNFQLTSNNIINYTHQNKRRIDFSYNISYDSDIDV